MTNEPDDLTLTDVSVPTSFSSIGPYRLIHMLGVGGMGEVWRAEQTAPLHRTVALKLIEVGMDTRRAAQPPCNVSSVCRRNCTPRSPCAQPRAKLSTAMSEMGMLCQLFPTL